MQEKSKGKLKKLFVIVGSLNFLFASVALSDSEHKKMCSDVLESLGYKLMSYSFKKRGLVTRERHTFNGDLYCYIDSGGNIHSIKDNEVLIAEEGFYGQDALAERDMLINERKHEIEDAKNRINEKYDIKFEELKKKYTPDYYYPTV